MIITNFKIVFGYLFNISPRLKLSANKNFYIDKNGELELITTDEIKKLFNKDNIHVSTSDIEKTKEYYPVSDEIDDNIITDDPYVKYCSQRLINLSKEENQLDKYDKFLDEWELYLQDGKRLTDYNQYPFIHIREIREDISKYFKLNKIEEDKSVTLRFVRNQLHQTLNNLNLMPYNHKSYRINQKPVEGSVLFWIGFNH